MWYQNIFSGSQLRAIQSTSLADIIRANTAAKNIQNYVFVFRTLIAGNLSLGSTKQLQPIRPRSRRTNGEPARRDRWQRGGHDNDEFPRQLPVRFPRRSRNGQYQIQLVATLGGKQAAATSNTISVTRGDQFFTGVNFVWTSTSGSQYSGGGQYSPWDGSGQYSGWDGGWCGGWGW